MTLVAPAPSRMPRPLPGLFWVTVVAFGLVSLAIALANPGTTFAGRSLEAAAAKTGCGSGPDRGGPLPLVRPAPTGLRGAVRAGRMRVVPRGVEHSGNGRRRGFHDRTRRSCARAGCRRPRGHGVPARSRVVEIGTHDRRRGVRRHASRPRSTSGAGFRARGSRVPSCPSNLLLADDNPQFYDMLNSMGHWLLVGWTTAFIALAVRRLSRSSGPLPRLTAPVLVAGSAYVFLILAAATLGVAPGLILTSSLAPLLSFAQAVALCAIGVAVGWSWLLRRRTRSQMAGLVVELGRSPPPGGLQEMLGRILGDPALRVAYALEGRQELADANGNAVDVAEGLAETPLIREGRTIALLLHRPGLLDDPAVVEEVAAATRLALDNERFRAEVLARIEDLRASRTRIVAAGEAERRRLERDLHDGAQQRLLSLSLALGFTRARLKEGADPPSSP